LLRKRPIDIFAPFAVALLADIARPPSAAADALAEWVLDGSLGCQPMARTVSTEEGRLACQSWVYLAVDGSGGGLDAPEPAVKASA
jgi:hypothetical protein